MDVHETLERHEHVAHGVHDPKERPIALLIAILAAILAICDMSARNAQNTYLAHNIAASDQYAFLQARELRALVLDQSAMLLDALQSTPETERAALAARKEATRLTANNNQGNGLQQILARATAEIKARDKVLDRYEWLESVASALQIAIVLASVSVLTRARSIAALGGALGLAATVLASLVVMGIV
jgi:Domain of unknown function (DUF4337)